jgi:TRAP-type C4-dicarboxylate transport system substrate-binding protein
MLVAVFSTQAIAEEKYNFRMQTLHSAPLFMKHNAIFVEKVRTATGGRINIEMFPSGSLVPTQEMAQAVGEGTLDMAFTYGGYHSGLIDVGNIESGLPMAWGNADEVFNFHFVYGFQDIAREAYDEIGVYWMTPVFEEPFLLISKKPVTSIEEMKNIKIRCTAPNAAILSQFGISTIYLPSEEFYTSMATGVIDAIIYGGEDAYAGLKLYEQAKYITDPKILRPMTSAIIINKKKWNSLPKDLQEALFITTREHYIVHWYKFRIDANREAAKYFEHKMFKEEDVKKLTTAAQKVWDKEAAKSPRCKKAIDLLKQLAKDTGRL